MADLINYSTNFRFSTNIIRRLGEELNPSPSQGLIELVKNAYDANALNCVIELHNTSKKKGTITITDDGDGMNSSDIMNGWLVLGKSEKKRRELTRLKRIPSGDKGLGRLAALRMGAKVNLSSISLKEPILRSELTIDWDRYKEDSLVEDIVLTIETTFNLDNQKPGTKISLVNLNSMISHDETQKLARSMILLADPFGDNPIGFKPVLVAPEYTDLEKIVEAKYFNEADFCLSAEVSHDGYASASVKNWLGNTIYSANHDEIRSSKKSNPYKCPKTRFDLWVYILSNSSFASRKASLTDIRAWLAEFGGVHLYYNGLRVSPYGDKGDDWLGLNLMRSRSPELRPSTNTSVGRVQVEDSNGLLIQKTDRSGFIVNEYFNELHGFNVDVLNWMARKRLSEREEKRVAKRVEAPKKSEREKESLEKVIASISSGEKPVIEAAFEKYYKAHSDEIKELQKEIQLYRTLSTVGITSSVFAHESNNSPLDVISQSIRTIRNRIIANTSEANISVNEPIERIIQSVDSLRVLANVTLSLIDHEKRKPIRVDLHRVITDLLTLYTPFIQGRDTEVTTEFDEYRPFVKGSVAAVEAVMSNLINNSLVAFERNSPSRRIISIRTKILSNIVELRVLDNGPGIQGISKDEMWLPGLTTRPNGTGLGLTIVRDTILDLGGNVDAVEIGDLGGAEIIIRLPVVKEDE
jgi:signal transduction histidine kinase